MNRNKIELAGNLTRDPHLSFTGTGRAVCEIAIAVNRVWKDASGTLQKEVDFFDVTLWGSMAENAAKMFTKGMPIFIDGHLKLDTWTDKETGSKRSKIKIIADHFSFVGHRGGKQEAAPVGGVDEDGNEDIPF